MQVTTLDMTIGQRIRELRERKDWSQEDLAREAAITAAALSRIELGKVDPRLSTLRAFAAALGLDLAALLKGVD